MPEQLHIRYHKWIQKEYKALFKSLRSLLEMESLQFYMPLMSLYFYIHNTPNSHKTIDFERRYYLQSVTEILKERYYNSNMIMRGRIYDSGKQCVSTKDIFCKTIPLVDPMHCLNHNYNFRVPRRHHLPSGYNYNTFHKVNDLNNTAYIDVFCSYLFGQLTFLKKSPSFPIFYGSANGIGDYKYDITEEYMSLRLDKCFNENLGKGFTMDLYGGSGSDSESEKRSRSSRSSADSADTSGSSVVELCSDAYHQVQMEQDQEQDDQGQDSVSESGSDSGSDYEDDCIAKIHKIPLQTLFIERLDATLEDYLLAPDFKEEVLVSCVFQVSFALAYLQKRYEFTHNDLHINNIMYQETTSKYLYYKSNNQYFRVPTYGKIFKIIDFGRAIFTFKNKTYRNDVFSRNSEAGGQYSYPHQVSFLRETVRDRYQSIGDPNYSFDLCRLCMTILEEAPRDKLSEDIYDFLRQICLDRNDCNFCDMTDDFNLYIAIAKDAIHGIPRRVIRNRVFSDYRVPKKRFPKKLYYSM
jgi:hypothetical protein